MTYRDMLIRCAQCGKEFVYRVEEQRRQASQGKEIQPPTLCPACRGEAAPQPAQPARPAPPAEQARLPKSKKVEATVALGPGPHEGTVKWYDSEKGYGFVAHPDGAEIFFHRTGVAAGERLPFADGTRVTFLIEQTEKGPQAVDVARMDGDAVDADA